MNNGKVYEWFVLGWASFGRPQFAEKCPREKLKESDWEALLAKQRADCGGDVLRLFPFRALLYKARENGKRGKVYFQGVFSQREIRWNRLKVP